MRISPELRTRITDHFYHYANDTQNESVREDSIVAPNMNESSLYYDTLAPDNLRTRIRDEIFFIDQAMLQSEAQGRVTVPRVEEKEISKTDFGNGQTGFGIQFNTVFVVQGTDYRVLIHVEINQLNKLMIQLTTNQTS